jgi:hypothetical protein
VFPNSLRNEGASISGLVNGNIDSVLGVCWSVTNIFYFMVQQPLVGQGLLFIKVSQSLTDTRNRS